MRVEIEKDSFLVFAGPTEVNILSGALQGMRKFIRRDPDGTAVYSLPMTYNVSEFLEKVFHVDGLIERFVAESRWTSKPFPWADANREFKKRGVYDPLGHQRECIDKLWPLRYGGVLHGPGCGKTYSAVTLTCGWFHAKRIDAVLVITPNSVVETWVEQINQHKWIDATVVKLDSGVVRRGVRMPSRGILYIVASVESFSQGHAARWCSDFVSNNRCAVVVDESTRIKNWKSIRTKEITSIGARVEHRIIMTGTVVTEKTENLYAQANFLSPRIFGMKSYFNFRNRYCVMGGFKGKNVVGSQNVEELMSNLSPFVHVVRKRDALPDLPPKMFERIYYDLTKQQIELIRSVKKERLLGETEIQNVLEAFLRMQQIANGNIPEEFGVELKENPKLNALVDLVEDIPEQLVIWAKEHAEMDMIVEAMKRLGRSCVKLSGQMKREERQKYINEFQNGELQTIVANPTSMGIGVTLHAAYIAIFYSNSFSYEEREQTCDRIHRIGQKSKSVIYYDLVCRKSIDEYVLKSLDSKQDVADFVINELVNCGTADALSIFGA